MRLLAPAKINLHLRVGPPRKDGFHPLMSWFATIGLFDTLTLNRTQALSAAEPWFSLRTDQPDLATDRRNLVTRAAMALADTHGRDWEGPTGRRERVSAFLEKRIPAGSGLGGGSSDAATALIGLNRLLGLNRTREELSALSAKLGSDLPFFFYGPSSVCTGRGEVVRPIAVPKPRQVLLVLPRFEMPTPAVYGRFDELRLGREDVVAHEPPWDQWVNLPAGQLLEVLANDLEKAAFSLRSELAELRQAVEKFLARPVRMSGSGSSLFTLYDDAAEADRGALDVARA